MGAGIIGLGVLQVLKATATVRIIVVDLSDNRLDMARALGADVIVNAGKEDALEKVIELTGEEELLDEPQPFGLADTVYDCAGLPFGYTGTPVVQQAFSMVKQNGKVVEVAVFEKPSEIQLNSLVLRGITLFGSWAWVPEEFQQSLDLIGTGKIDRKPLISHRFPLESGSEAYETQLNTDKSIKVMIIP